MKALPIIAALALASCSPAKPDITVTDAWSRPTNSAAQPAVVYLTLTNSGSGDDRLTAVETKVAGRASMHISTTADGVMRMRAIDGVDIPAGETVRLSPAGSHIMLEQLAAPLNGGSKFTLTLRFQHSAPTQVSVTVRADSAPMEHQHGH